MRPYLLLTAVVLAACSSKNPDPATRPATRQSRPPRAQRETVAVRDPDIEKRLSRLELRVMEKEAQVEELQTRLDDARDEVVSTMAKLRTLASRAEAASAMAEADVAMQTFRSSDGARALPEMAQATQMVQRSTGEFNKENYGGALYLANQAKSLAAAGQERLQGNRGTTRPGETPFALPIRVRAASRGNVREGPGTNFPVAFEVNGGALLTAFSYTEEWIRIADDGGRGGWIFRTLVERP